MCRCRRWWLGKESSQHVWLESLITREGTLRPRSATKHRPVNLFLLFPLHAVTQHLGQYDKRRTTTGHSRESNARLIVLNPST